MRERTRERERGRKKERGRGRDQEQRVMQYFENAKTYYHDIDVHLALVN